MQEEKTERRRNENVKRPKLDPFQGNIFQFLTGLLHQQQLSRTKFRIGIATKMLMEY